MNGNVIYILVILLMILLSAAFSAMETAFSSLNKTRIRTLAEKGKKRAELVCRLTEQYDQLISTILIGNNIVNIVAASLGTVLFVRLCGGAGVTVSTVVITLAVLVFSEITPKSIAKDCPERAAMFFAPFIRTLIWFMTPVNYVFSHWKKWVSSSLNLRADDKVSQDELLMLVDEVEESGSIDQNEGELLRNAIEFTDQDAESILTHRIDLVAVPRDATKQEIARKFSESKVSRILVYGRNIDNILGVIHQKDFYDGDGITGKPIRDIISPVIFVLKSEKVSDLLRTLQKNKTHMAVVLDEYGGTYGIVTMEDILEELVGEIWDEHDEVEETFRKVNDDTWLVDGAANLDDFCEYFQLEIDSEVVSVSGWVTEQFGKIPSVGEGFSFGPYHITVTAVNNHRVEQLEIRKTEALPEEPEEGPAE